MVLEILQNVATTMQVLLIISFVLIIATGMFLGSALAGGYAPYATFVSAFLYLLAMFMPFLSEYNILHRGFSEMGGNVMSLFRPQQQKKGEVEIIMPGQTRPQAETYKLEQKSSALTGVILVVVIASLLFSYDLVQFYILGDGLKSDSGPISNF